LIKSIGGARTRLGSKEKKNNYTGKKKKKLLANDREEIKTKKKGGSKNSPRREELTKKGLRVIEEKNLGKERERPLDLMVEKKGKKTGWDMENHRG